MKKLYLMTSLLLVFGSLNAQVNNKKIKNTVKKTITNIRKGKSINAVVLYNWDGKILREGSSTDGQPILNYDGKILRSGDTNVGQEISSFENNIINGKGYYLKFDGLYFSALEKIFYNWDGRLMRKGESEYGNVVFNTDGDLPIPVVAFLGFLIDR